MGMKKTSIYLTDDEVEGLRRLAAATGRPQAALVRDAVTEYVTKNAPKRKFLSAGAGASGSKRSIADEDLDRLLYEILEKRLRDEQR